MTLTTSPARRLIVNADDFGRSPEINRAVARAHQNGLLTTASLMVNEPAADEAVRVARDLPHLGVGLHLTLTLGHSTLGPNRIPGLTNARHEFRSGPVAAGFRYFALTGLRPQLRDELNAQFERFHAFGLPLDHVNGHLHFHLHPVILELLLEQAAQWGVTRVRFTHDPFRLNLRLARGRWLFRAFHAAIFKPLCRHAAPRLRAARLKHTQHAFGLLQDARVDEQFLLQLLPSLPPGDSEVFSHPSTDQFPHELEALTSPRVRQLADDLGIQRIRYSDL